MTHLFNPYLQAEDGNGTPYAGALLYFYTAGTTTPITVYQDAAKATPHANPVVADSSGLFAAIFVDTNAYKTILKTSGGTTIQTVDNIYRGGGFDSSGYVTGPGYHNTAADSVTILAGGLSSTTGGLIQLYGPSHATQANDIVMRSNSGQAVYQYDHSAPLHDWYVPANTLALRLNSASLSPGSNDLLSLGTTAASWSDLYGATGFTWNINNGNWVATHTSAVLTVGTGDLRVTTAGTNSASVVTVGGTQTLTAKTLTSPVINTPVFPTGSWTPAVAFGGVSTGITYGTQVGTYETIGNETFCAFSIILTADGTPPTGNMTITGLPVTVSTGMGVHPKNASNFSGLTGALSLDPQTSTTTVLVRQSTATGNAAITEARSTDTLTIGGVIHIKTA